MDADDLELFDRTIAHAVGDHRGPALDAALEELGWRDALDDDDRAATSVLFTHLGAAHASCGALDHVVAAALGIDGEAAGLVLPALGRTEPPGDLDRDRLHVAGLALAHLADQPAALVPVATDDGDVVLEVATDALTLRPVHGIDPALGLVEVTADGIDVDLTAATPVDWPAAVAAAQRALGHELVGASRTMLDLAREHALGRVQFGQPIAGFQAVRHRLAETLVAIESAEAVLDGAWEDRSPVTAAMAKSTAGRAARTTARHGQQVLAGIGFTTEHDLHLFIRRALALDELFGSSRALTAQLGRDVLATRRLPPLLPL